MFSKNCHTVLIILSVLFGSAEAGLSQTKSPTGIDLGSLDKSHSVNLSDWGPYSKKYAGISHVQDIQSGLRFDFSVVPGYYRNTILVPNVLFESGYFPWENNGTSTRYTYRYQLEWKDKVYADVTYHVIDQSTVLTAIKCTNNTAVPQNLVLNLMSFIDYPDDYPDRQAIVANGAIWYNATDYESLSYGEVSPQDNLVYDGFKRGEIRNREYINGTAIGDTRSGNYLGGTAVTGRFGRDKGDRATYTVAAKANKGNIVLVYRMKQGAQGTFKLDGLIQQEVVLKGTGAFENVEIPYETATTTAERLIIESQGSDAIEFNGFFIVPQQGTYKTASLAKNFVPEKIENLSSQNVLLKYPDMNTYYGLGWDSDNFEIREVLHDELDIFFRRKVHNHVDKVLKGNGKGHYTNVFIRPVAIAPNTQKTVYAMLCNGERDLVQKRLKDFESIKQDITSKQDSKQPAVLPEGDKYTFARNMLQATLLSNVVYPVYTQGNYIKHFTPGKNWNSLYTWDSGFISIGFNEVNTRLAIECINAYTTDAESQSAFIHHGSPLPVQMYAFFDLWNRTQSTALLTYFYPRLKRYYEFLAGRKEGSTTRMPSNMLKTWDYFYNSAGWDDYPAQVALHKQKKEQYIAPVANTAHQIRVAKMLKLAAEALGKKADLQIYDKDIADFTAVLHKHAWNEESGYFSYVVHDDNGQAVGKFRHESGKDYNMGLDGAYPLFAGICTPQQEKTLLDKMFSDSHLWTPSGMGVVDQSAPYYRPDGYWNGAVWMPHQWFMWKTMLDIGRTDLARKIAQKALDIYSTEVNETYHTFEHFFAKTGRGAGWHQFSGLSTPILSWYATYFQPGTVTTGFEIWIKQQAFHTDSTRYEAVLAFDNSTEAHTRSLLLCLNPDHDYRVTFDGQPIDFDQPFRGLLEIRLPATNRAGHMEVSPIKHTAI